MFLTTFLTLENQQNNNPGLDFVVFANFFGINIPSTAEQRDITGQRIERCEVTHYSTVFCHKIIINDLENIDNSKK